MSNETPGAGVRWFVCEDGHVHLTFIDENNQDIVSFSIDIEDWLDLTDAIDEEIYVQMAVEESAKEVKH